MSKQKTPTKPVTSESSPAETTLVTDATEAQTSDAPLVEEIASETAPAEASSLVENLLSTDLAQLTELSNSVAEQQPTTEPFTFTPSEESTQVGSEEITISGELPVVVEEQVEPVFDVVEQRNVALQEELQHYVDKLREYAENMNRGVEYNSVTSGIQQHHFINLIKNWVSKAVSKEESDVNQFYAIGKIIREWFAEHVEDGCASADLLHRGLLHPSLGLSSKTYQQHLSVCNLFTRLTNSSVRTVMSGNEKEVYDHFAQAEMKPRFLDLVIEGISSKRL